MSTFREKDTLAIAHPAPYPNRTLNLRRCVNVADRGPTLYFLLPCAMHSPCGSWLQSPPGTSCAHTPVMPSHFMLGPAYASAPYLDGTCDDHVSIISTEPMMIKFDDQVLDAK